MDWKSALDVHRGAGSRARFACSAGLVLAAVNGVFCLPLSAEENVAAVPGVVTQADAPAPPVAGPTAPEPAAPINLERDLAIIVGLRAPGWEALSPEILSRSPAGLITPEGTSVLEAAGQSAAVLLECGCLDVVSRSFTRGRRVVTATIFRFPGPAQAYAAYTNMRHGASTVIARGNGSSEDDANISFWKGDAFVALTTSCQDDDEAKEVLSKFADLISAKVCPPAAGLPNLMKALPGLDRVQGSEKMVFGPVGARRYTHTPLISSLSMEHCLAAAYAEYQYSSPISERLQLLVIEYKEPARARQAFSDFSLAAVDGKIYEQTDNRFLAKCNDGIVLAQVSGPRLAVISGARKKFAPALLARQIR